MAENSKIEWCDHTFNPWIGCQKVSAGCDHCYAESLAKRYGWVEWGQRKTDDTEASAGERKRTSDANWKLPLRWAKAARGTGRRPRVFCASLADWLDNQVPREWRYDLWRLIEATPELDWLLLTKRIENYEKLAPWHANKIPPNIWLGTTCEDQERADKRVSILRHIPATIKFLSCEPMIGHIDLERGGFALHRMVVSPSGKQYPGINWVICGGESGHGARMMAPGWAASLKQQCEAAGVAFFLKQMTGKKPIPDHLMLRQFPAVPQ